MSAQSTQPTQPTQFTLIPADEATAIAQSAADIAAEQVLLDVAHARADQIRASSQQLTSAIEAEKTAEALAFERIKAEGKVAAEALRHDRLERQVAQAIEDRIAAEHALTQAAQEKQRAEAQAARELALCIENDARVLEAVRVRMEAEHAATRVEREKLDVEAEATQHNKVRIETERKADAAAQERLRAVEDLQKEITLQRETARQADAQRQLRLQVEWQAFRGSLKIMGRYWLAGMSVLFVLLGWVMGILWGMVMVNAEISGNEASPYLADSARPASVALQGADDRAVSDSRAALFSERESDRLADMPIRLQMTPVLGALPSLPVSPPAP